jgi:hypothetical protein
MNRILTPKQECEADCPKGDHPWTKKGEVVRCEHGAYHYAWRYISYERRWDKNCWIRLSRFWYPIRYRRAVKVLSGEGRS